MTTTREFQVTFDALDPAALAAFWKQALGYVHPPPPGVELADGEDPLAAWEAFLERAGVPEADRNNASALGDPTGRGPRIFVQRVPEAKQAKNRVHLDIRAAPDLVGDERMAVLETECDRLVALGASRVNRSEPDGRLSNGFIVMADPEGNEFCLD